MMRRILISGMMGMFMMTTLSGFLHAQTNKGAAKTESPATPSAVELKLAMRELWEEHVMYTRNYIISAVAHLDDFGAIAGRLLKNQDDRCLALTTGEVVARLKKDWTADIAAYDQGDAHMLMFADVLTKGILKQFPDKFKK